MADINSPSAICLKSTLSHQFKIMEKIGFIILTFTMLTLNLINDLSIILEGKSILGLSYIQYQ